jgi:predicted transcriptional regulator
MRLSEIQEILKADVLAGESQLEKPIMAAGGADLMEDVLAAIAQGSVLLTGLTTEQTLQTARIAGVGAIVFVRGKRPDADTVRLAENWELPLLSTRYSLFVASGRLYINGLRGLDGSW